VTPRWILSLAAGVLTTLSALLATAGPATPPGADEWKYDIVYRRVGEPLKGLVIENNTKQIVLKWIVRKPGTPTILWTTILTRDEVERVELLGPEERARLQKRLAALKNEREFLGAQLKLLDPGARSDLPSGDAVTLKPAAWPPDPKGKALSYQSTHFQLISNAREEMLQLAAIQLEQVYAAYARTLPPRATAAQPTTILLVRSLAEYQNLLRDQGRNFFNPAFYDLARNQIVCGSDLQRLADERERSRSRHTSLLAELEESKTELQQIYKGKVPAELLAPILEDQKKIKWTTERNSAAFALAKQRFFQRLYHEAFHAYLANFVYPPSEAEVPVWFNEGLAQIFETAIFEVGELRVGHADKERLEAVRLALARGTLLPLTDLLRSGPAQFQVAHNSAQKASDRHYLASWALAFYLTFGRKVLGSKAMDIYVRALKRGADPLEAFRDLVGQPLAEFEKGYLQYLKSLRHDGTTGHRD
jgi:Protein of unknown function (DUF1570)